MIVLKHCDYVKRTGRKRMCEHRVPNTVGGKFCKCPISCIHQREYQESRK